MNIWILERLGSTGYDESLGFVVRAASPQAARLLCAANCGDEGSEAWTDPLKSYCRLLTPRGYPRVLLHSFNPG